MFSPLKGPKIHEKEAEGLLHKTLWLRTNLVVNLDLNLGYSIVSLWPTGRNLQRKRFMELANCRNPHFKYSFF